MSVNDRLFDELPKPVAEDYYTELKGLSALGDDLTRRAWHLGRMHTLVEVGDRIAAVLDVPSPEWETMRVLAGRES